eukprot:UN06006
MILVGGAYELENGAPSWLINSCECFLHFIHPLMTDGFCKMALSPNLDNDIKNGIYNVEYYAGSLNSPNMFKNYYRHMKWFDKTILEKEP